MPISRVRSVTDTSMMFIMPMPPTTREMAAMPARISTIMLIMLVIVLQHLAHAGDGVGVVIAWKMDSSSATTRAVLALIGKSIAHRNRDRSELAPVWLMRAAVE